MYSCSDFFVGVHPRAVDDDAVAHRWQLLRSQVVEDMEALVLEHELIRRLARRRRR